MNGDVSTMRPVARLVVLLDDQGQVALNIGLNGRVPRRLLIEALETAAFTLRNHREIDVLGSLASMLTPESEEQP